MVGSPVSGKLAGTYGNRPFIVLGQVLQAVGLGWVAAIAGPTSDTLNWAWLSALPAPQLECIDMCTRSWNHFFPSLRIYLETGQGNPRGIEADEAWRREAYGTTAS